MRVPGSLRRPPASATDEIQRIPSSNCAAPARGAIWRGFRATEKPMPKMRSVQVARPKGPFELVERDIPAPRAGTARIKVQACGICHSDAFTKEGTFPGLQYPRVPGHEIAGVIDALGAGVAGWTEGQRVGVGWH